MYIVVMIVVGRTIMKAGAKVLNIWKIGFPRIAVAVLYLLSSMGPINAKKARGRKMV